MAKHQRDEVASKPVAEVFRHKTNCQYFTDNSESMSSEKEAYSQLFGAVQKLNSQAAKVAENQKSVLAHNSKVASLTEEFRTVQDNFKKAASGKPSTS